MASVGVATLVLLGPVALAGLVGGGARARQDGASRPVPAATCSRRAALAVLVIGVRRRRRAARRRPGGGSVADALAALGVGLLIGLALSGHRRTTGGVGA